MGEEEYQKMNDELNKSFDDYLNNKLSLGCKIKLGTILAGIINVITIGQGKHLASWIATKLGYESCGCCEREEWLNKLTCKSFDGKCNQIKLW